MLSGQRYGSWAMLSLFGDHASEREDLLLGDGRQEDLVADEVDDRERLHRRDLHRVGAVGGLVGARLLHHL